MTVSRPSGAVVKDLESGGLDLIPGRPFCCGWDPVSSSGSNLRGWLWGSVQYRHIEPLTRGLAPTPGATIVIGHEEGHMGQRSLEGGCSEETTLPSASIPDSCWIGSSSAPVSSLSLVCFLVYLPFQAITTLRFQM